MTIPNVEARHATGSTARLAPEALELVRRSRRHPRPTQFDYLHVRSLLDDIRSALGGVTGDVRDVLDVYCGSRPYDDLFPAGARHMGLDIVDNPYGVADVASDEFLPFDDEAFDLVTCFEAFHYVPDPEYGVAELWRVLRPGGTALVSVPFAWEYNATILEHRYTEPELRGLFRAWSDVRVVESGGQAIVWATVTGSLLESLRKRLPRRLGAPFGLAYLGINGFAAMLDRVERRRPPGPARLPMNLLLVARRPA